MLSTFNNLIVSSRKDFYQFFERILAPNNNKVKLLNGNTYKTIVDDTIVEIKPLEVELEGNNIYVTYMANGEKDITELSILSLDEVIKVGEILMEEF